MESVPTLRPRILERYVAREFLKLWALTLVTFISVFLIADFFEKIDRLVQAKLPLGSFLAFFAIRIPMDLGHVLPASVLLAGILTFAMLSRRNESMAIKTSGLDILCLLRPVIFWSAAVTLTLFALNLFFIPWSQQKYDQFWQTQVEKKPLPSLSKLERFWYKGDNAIYNILLFRKDTQTLEGVKVYLFDRQFHLIKIIAATRAQWWKSVPGERGEVQLWHFYQGFTQSFGPGEKMAGEKFGEMVQPLTEHSNDFSFLERKDREMDQIDLYRYINRLERDGYDSTQYRVEFHSRISQSVAPLILVILGIALVLRREKVNIPATVAVGTAIYFGYWLFFGFCTSFGRAGRWPVLLADWLPHLAFAILTIFLLRQASR